MSALTDTRRSFSVAAVCAAISWAVPAPAQASSDIDPPSLERIEDTTTVEMIQPTNTMLGTRGLPQTFSAEALGEGRLVLGLAGPWYRQQRAYSGSPNADADIFTGIGSVAYGIDQHWDIFASLTAWGTQNYNGPQGSGLGTLQGGVLGTLPFKSSSPVRLAAQASVINGLSDNPIDSNQAGGYNYFETRTGLDFRGDLLQTVVAGSEATALKLHFNEGVVTSMESGVDPLLLLGAGVQMNVPMAALGLELHSRTALEDVNFRTDPLWLTPSLQFRGLYAMNVTLGGDVSLSRDRSSEGTGPALRALEPFRLFGGVAFSLDTWAEKRRQEKLDALRASRERELLKSQALAAAQKAREDSAAAAAARTQAEDISILNEEMSAKSVQDSLAMAERARQDSLALADAQRRLAEERSKRSDMENQLLTTGLLVMDAVYFETGKSDISINSKPYLDMLAKMLTKYPKLQIEVAGHTDNVGGDAYNMGLSQARAASVRDYMADREPGLGARLTARGYGESNPKADNSTAAGRRMNRRTELQVLNKEALQEYNEPVSSARPGEGSREAMGSSGEAGTGAAPRGGTEAGSGSMGGESGGTRSNPAVPAAPADSIPMDSAGTPIPSPEW